jgi:hypothetical protein
MSLPLLTCTPRRAPVGLATNMVGASIEPAVVVAVIAASASVIVSLVTAITSSGREKRVKQLEHQLSQEDKVADRRAEVEKVLARYSEPLLAAAFDLQSRIYNILDQSFLVVYGPSNERHEEAILSTLYRIGQYLAWTEILRRDILFLDFRQPEKTRTVANLISRIAHTFATDRYGHELMLWSEEQRGIGERLIERVDGSKSCIGYAAFRQQYAEDFRPWLGRVELELTRGIHEGYGRLRELRDRLRELVQVLDPHQTRYEQRWRAEENRKQGEPESPGPAAD